MSHALDLMNREPVTVSPETSIRDLARLLLSQRLDGVCVVENGKLVGVVTAMDVIFQERRVALPSYVRLLSRLVPSSASKHSALEKATGSIVRDIMTPSPIGVAFDAAIEQIAELMVEHHITVVPVLEHGALIGVIHKRDLLQAALSAMGADRP